MLIRLFSGSYRQPLRPQILRLDSSLTHSNVTQRIFLALSNTNLDAGLASSGWCWYQLGLNLFFFNATVNCILFLWSLQKQREPCVCPLDGEKIIWLRPPMLDEPEEISGLVDIYNPLFNPYHIMVNFFLYPFLIFINHFTSLINWTCSNNLSKVFQTLCLRTLCCFFFQRKIVMHF